MTKARTILGSNAPGKLGLGCVALGQDYGRARPTRRSGEGPVRELLESAHALGIRVLDTAPAYGDSEARLGALRPADASFAVVSKVSWKASASAELSLKTSLEALRLPSLYGLLAHSAAELLDPSHGRGRFTELERLRDEGRVRRLGASVYTPDEARDLLVRFPSLDLMQLPMSVLDRRFENSGLLAELADRGVEVHARSVLLQGALTLAPEALPPALAELRAPLAHFRSSASDSGLAPLEAAIAYVCARAEVDVVLVGATTASELATCCAAESCAISLEAFEDCAASPSSVDPRCWEGGPS